MTTREASIKWYEHTYPKAFANGVKEELILEEWMQEVVLPHFSGFIKYDNQDHQILAEIYLQEHEVKEEVLNPEIGLTEQPEVSLPVSETMDQKCLRTFNNRYFVDGDPDKDFIRSTIGSHEFKYALKLGSDIGSEWQKGKDKVLIQGLLDALSDIGYDLKGAAFLSSKLESAITKANEFLNS